MTRLIESCWRMIEFLAQMPTDSMLLLATAVRGFAALLNYPGLAYSPSRPFWSSGP